MTEQAAPIALPLPSTSEAHETRWPALAALATAGILPATTARRTTHVRLGSAFLVHFSAVLAIVIVLAFFVEWESRIFTQEFSFGEVYAGVLKNTGQLIYEFERAPGMTLLFVVGPVLGAGMGYLVLALFCAPWGAIEESLGASLRSAVQRAWLHTPHLALLVALCGATGLALEQARQKAERGVWEEVQRRVRQLEAERRIAQNDWGLQLKISREVWGEHPFLVRNAPVLIVALGIGGTLWWLWGLLRFVGAGRPLPVLVRDPTCENCGYNLTGIPLDGRCPECGDPVVRSLAPDARPGTCWQRRGKARRWRTWWECTWLALFEPTRFGRQIRVSGQPVEHRWFLAGCIPFVFLVGWIGLLLCYVAATGRNPWADDREVIWGVGPVLGAISCVVVLIAALAAAALIGVVQRMRTGRNLLPAAMQAACYLSGYLVPWTLLAFAWMAVLLAGDDLLRAIAREVRIERGFIALGLWGLLNLLAGAIYLWLVARITSAARYANR